MAFERTITSRGKKYRQLVESRWDPIKKQSRIHVLKHLGKVIEENGKEKVISPSISVDSFESAFPVGKLALFWQIGTEFNVKGCITKSIGADKKDVSDAIFIMILNQLMGRKALTKLGTWVEKSPLSRWMKIDTSNLTKDYFLSALDSVSKMNEDGWYSHALDIQQHSTQTWRKKIGNEPARLFIYKDITRIKYNGSCSYWAEKGYGAQIGRPHIGYGLVTSKDNLMPILGFPIRGSHSDSTTVKKTVDSLDCMNLKNLVFVWDRGFVSNKNIAYACKSGHHVLSGGKLNSKEIVNEMVKYDDSEIEKRTNILQMGKGQGIYYKDWLGELYGQDCRIVVILNPMKRNNERTMRDILIQQLETSKSKKEIANLKKQLKPIVKKSRGRRGYILDYGEEEKARKRDGRHIFFCTDTKITGMEIVKTYFQKDQVENAFRLLKGTSLGPIRYQIPGRVETYLSVISFLAYEIMAATMWTLKEHKIKLSYDELLNQLKNVSEIKYKSKGKIKYQWTHITKANEDIFRPFGILNLRHSY